MRIDEKPNFSMKYTTLVWIIENIYFKRGTIF